MIRILLFLFFICLPIIAKTVYVTPISDFQSEIAILESGDVLVLRNGVYKDIQINLTIPDIIVTGESIDETIITGKSRISVMQNYINLENITFYNTDAIIEEGVNPADRGVIRFSGVTDNATKPSYCVVENVNFFDDRAPEVSVNKILQQTNLRNPWVYIHHGSSSNITIKNNSFEGKSQLGPVIFIRVGNSESGYNHLIENNYFGYRPTIYYSHYGELISINGCENIQIGSGYTSRNRKSNTTITNNAFENFNGEGEIISLKSMSNVIANNLFLNCYGNVTVRFGSKNNINGNTFWNDPGRASGNFSDSLFYNSTTNGVRLYGDYNFVKNNVFFQTFGVSISSGEESEVARSYTVTSNNHIRSNSFINNSPFLHISYKPETSNLSNPRFNYFSNNIIVDSKPFITKDNSEFDDNDCSGIIFHDNIIYSSSVQSLNEFNDLEAACHVNSTNVFYDPNYYVFEETLYIHPFENSYGHNYSGYFITDQIEYFNLKQKNITSSRILNLIIGDEDE